MKLLQYISLFLLLVVAGGNGVSAQETIYTDDDVHISYNREVFAGFIANTQGWGFNFAKNFFRTVDKRVNYEIQMSFVRDLKQKKVYNPYYRDAKGYYYGKLNSFFVLRGMYGQRKILGHKIRSKGVELGYSWGIGPSLGFLRPVYLEVINFDQNTLEIVKYDPTKHDLQNIYGRAGGLRGLNELQFRPGIYFKAGMYVEYSSKKIGISGIEAGAAIDAYFQPIEIMAYEDIKDQQFFPLLYINIFFGTKFNKY